MPGHFPCFAHAAMTLSTAAWTFGLPVSPGMPISIDRSLEPTSRQSMPGTAAIASAFSTALGVSIITTISVFSSDFVVISPSGIGS